MRWLPILVLLISACIACEQESKVNKSLTLDSSRMPTMKTVNVSTLISDSGVTQYKIVAPVWYVYDQADTPYWNFPEGLYLRKYDTRFNVIATVAADSAKYFKLQRLWRLDGNVELTNAPSDIFITPQLFWDERKAIIYNDTFIHIENSDHTIEGLGFVSDDRLTQYRIIKPTGIFPVDRENLQGGDRPREPRRGFVDSIEAKPDNTLAPI